jgi:hypothetical protein
MTELASAPGRSWLRRIGWLALIWTASVALLGLLALLMRLLMGLVGLTA